MKVSVVMTTYNGERFLPQMLESLMNQTRKIDELLIFDDQSNDNTYKIVNNFIEVNKLVEWNIYRNEINLGWEKNYVQGLKAASGDIIFPCDQDDIWHLDKIEKMIEAFEYDDNILLLVSGFNAFSEFGGKMTIQNPVKTENNKMVSKVIFDKTYYQILRPGCTMSFRKEIMPYFLENWTMGTPHDAVLWDIAILQKRLYLYNDTFIEYRRHNNNASKKISHGYRYKVNEIQRTQKINIWYKNSPFFDKSDAEIIDCCNIWCSYRYKLIVEKKLVYWFKLFPLRDCYLTTKKYIGDLYYFMSKQYI